MGTEAEKGDNKALAKTQNQAAPLSPSERFTEAILKEFTTNSGEVNITNFQRKICQNYFIKLDATLKELEQKRLAKSEQYREAIPYTWDYVNLGKLSRDAVAFSNIGMDPLQKNHISLIPYADSKTNKYNITFIEGYVGLELKAKKYGFEIPDDVIIEVVFKNENFIPLKKDKNNPVESYIYGMAENPFDRGEVVGGFYYHNYFDKPQKNKLRIFSLADIEKRRPDKASAEFWGGEKDEYKDGKKTGKKIKVEGWFEEMCYKTIARAAYDSIAIDSEKIDENFLATILAESEHQNQLELTQPTSVQNQISSRANQTLLTMGPETEDATHEEIKPELFESNQKTEPADQMKQDPAGDNKTDDGKPAELKLKF